jgi:hypothetical protein
MALCLRIAIDLLQYTFGIWDYFYTENLGHLEHLDSIAGESK